MYVCMYVCMYLCLYVCMYVCMYVHICIYVYIYIYIYTHITTIAFGSFRLAERRQAVRTLGARTISIIIEFNQPYLPVL